MVGKGKKRVSITVDSERFERVSSLLDQRGYPRGSLSHYIDVCISKLEYYLDPAAVNPPAFDDSFFELEVARVGLKAASEMRGLKVVKWDAEDEKPREF